MNGHQSSHCRHSIVFHARPFVTVRKTGVFHFAIQSVIWKCRNLLVCAGEGVELDDFTSNYHAQVRYRKIVNLHTVRPFTDRFQLPRYLIFSGRSYHIPIGIPGSASPRTPWKVGPPVCFFRIITGSPNRLVLAHIGMHRTEPLFLQLLQFACRATREKREGREQGYIGHGVVLGPNVKSRWQSSHRRVFGHEKKAWQSRRRLQFHKRCFVSCRCSLILEIWRIV